MVVIVGSTAAYLLGARQNRSFLFSEAPQTPTITYPSRAILQPSLSSFPISIGQADPTANWKTFTNQAYKYMLKYPAAWTIDTSHLTDALSTVTFSSPDLKYSTDSGFPSYGATININAEKTDLHTLDELYTQIAGNRLTKVRSKSYIVLDGVKGLRLQIGGVEMPDGTDIHFIHNGNHYSLQFWEIGVNYSQMFNQVLSTFTFTE